MIPTKVLGRLPRPTEKSYKEAVGAIVIALQADHGLTDKDLADRLGCSDGTITNARNGAGKLNGATLAAIEHEFGPGALDPFLALGGSRAVPKSARCNSDARPCVPMVDALQSVIEMEHPDSDGGISITTGECRKNLARLRAARLALDHLIELGEMPAIGEAA